MKLKELISFSKRRNLENETVSYAIALFEFERLYRLEKADTKMLVSLFMDYDILGHNFHRIFKELFLRLKPIEGERFEIVGFERGENINKAKVMFKSLNRNLVVPVSLGLTLRVNKYDMDEDEDILKCELLKHNHYKATYESGALWMVEGR